MENTEEITPVAEEVVETPAVVDQQMLDENPVLAEAGVEVGTPIEEVAVEEVAPAAVEETPAQ